MLASIPSPSGGAFSVGPLELRAYGLMIALGALAAVTWSQRRYAARGGDPEAIASIALWAIPAGLVGARLYHVATDWRSFRGRWGDVLAVWQGGLGIPGGLIVGVLAGAFVARRRGLAVGTVLDVMVPTIPVAQAIGRWGNWFNQEVFGRPSNLPWALEIDAAHRPIGYASVETFHPTFLYECLWNVALALVLVRVERRGVLRPGYVTSLWVSGYGLGRLWVELLRSDAASLLVGVRVNVWMAVIAVLVGGFVFCWGLKLGNGDRMKVKINE